MLRIGWHCTCFGQIACLCVVSGCGGMLQHTEGVRLPLCEEGSHLCEGERRAEYIFSEGKRQTRLIYQWLFCHSATPGGGQLRTTHTPTIQLSHPACVEIAARTKERLFKLRSLLPDNTIMIFIHACDNTTLITEHKYMSYHLWKEMCKKGQRK